jgi:TonB-linked SusC/RagA family outer membrane protein
MRKKALNKILLLVIGVFIFFHSHAQQKTVTGSVLDEKGQPLSGATITVKGFKTATTTDANGKFTLTIPPGGKSLVVSFVGMADREVAIGNSTTLTVTLNSSSSTLGDVVVIGYGTQKRGDVNGAISSVSSRDIADIPQSTVDQMLQGKAAGVTVTENSGAPGAAVSVRVRGITSFSGSEPLYVVDGVQIDGNANTGQQLTSLASPSQQETSPSVLASLNPNDIESIDILKDASATAIYGSRGANGVVIITTKRAKAGQSRITYDGYYGDQEQGKFLNVMKLPQYAAYENTLAGEFGVTPRVEFSNPSKLGPGTDWQEAIFRRAPQTSNTLAFSGANNKTDYYVSGGYFQQKGTVIGSDFNRYSFHAAVNSTVNDWFKMGTSISANQNKADIGLGNSYGIIYNALLQAPDAAVYNADGTFAGPAVVNGTIEGGLNPVQQALNITNYLVRQNIQGNLHADILFTKDLTLHNEIGGNLDWSQAKTFLPTYSYGATGSSAAFVNTQASLNEYDYLDNYWDWLEQLNYNHTFAGKHAVTAQVFREVWESTSDGVGAGTKGFTAGNAIQTLGLGTQSNNTETENKGSNVMESYVARLIYTYDEKYSITATDRRDQSSNFAPGHQIGYFPGVAASWRLSQESFMDGMDRIVSNLKIRLGLGTTGNSNTGGQYKYGSAIQPVVTGLGTGFSFFNFSNPNLTWETAIQKNAGVDFSLIHNRIDASFDIYEKTSRKFLFQQPLPAFLAGGVAEFSTAAIVQPPWVNAGQIQNKGFEFSITSRNIVKRDFNWTTNVVFSHYTNKVTSLNGAPPLIGIVSTGFGPQINATTTQVGKPVGEFYGYKTQGLITTNAQLAYLAANPQNVIGSAEPISSDRTLSNSVYLGDIFYAGNTGKGGPNQQYALGNPNPDFTYGMTNTFTYKQFELSVFITGSYGGKILNAVDYQLEGLYGLYQNQLAEAANFWTPTNPNSHIPAPRSGFGNNNLVMSDRFLQSASYLRLQNLRFGYNLPPRWANMAKLQHLRVYFSGQNIFVITPYKGLDPEVGSLNQNPILQNIDYGRYPSPRTLTFGLNAEF